MLTPEATEVELKLRVSPADYARLARHPALQGGEAPELHRLYAVYFDTAQHGLWRAGLALRVRRDGALWTQTLKGAGSAEAGLHRRIELEATVPGPRPDLDVYGPGPWTERLVAALAGEPLHRVCVTQFTRSTRTLHRLPDAVIEASLDRGEIRAAGRREPLCELELELKAGPPAALYELALELLDAFPVAAEQRSKAERGYALQAAAADVPAKGAPPALDPGMTVGAALSAIVGSVLAHLQANEAGLKHHSDPEYVHQMRVALRRLRSALSVFRPALDAARRERAMSEMRWLARSLGAARDWDVFMGTACAQLLEAFPGHPGLAEYVRVFRRQQRLARQRAQRAVGSVRYQRLVLELGAWLQSRQWCAPDAGDAAAVLEQRVEAYAGEVLEALYSRMRKRGRHIAQLAPEQLHELRIAAKKLRYATHFFAGLYDAKAAHPLLDRLAQLQDALGAVNDAATVQSLVDAARPGAGKHVAEARGLLLAWSRGQTALLRRDAERAWRAARRCPTFW